LFMLGAGYFVSIANVLTAKLAQLKVPSIAANTWGMFYGLLVNAAIALVGGAPFNFDWRPGYVVSLVYLTVFSTMVGFVLYFVLVRRIGSARASYFTLLAPFVAVVLSALVEGMAITPALILGGLAVLAGNFLAMRGARAPATGSA